MTLFSGWDVVDDPVGMASDLTYVWAWLQAFAFTQAIEIPIYAHYLRHTRRQVSRDGIAAEMSMLEGSALSLTSRCLLAFGASAITHPFVWFIFPWLFPANYWMMVAFAECFAVGVEAFYLAKLKVERAFWVSLLANGMSAGIGLLSRSILGWP